MKKAAYRQLNNTCFQAHIHLLISFILGAAMTTACILYISVNPCLNTISSPNPNLNLMELSPNWTGASVNQDKVDQDVTQEIKEEVPQMEVKEAVSTGQEAKASSLITSPAPEVI
jgi:hypothetical protein